MCGGTNCSNVGLPAERIDTGRCLFLCQVHRKIRCMKYLGLDGDGHLRCKKQYLCKNVCSRIDCLNDPGPPDSIPPDVVEPIPPPPVDLIVSSTASPVKELVLNMFQRFGCE